MCITIQEQVEYFKKRCENTSIGKKTKQQGDINIPIQAIEKACSVFRPKERYLFTPKHAGGDSMKAISSLRINLLWKLARQKESIAVYGDNQQFEKDFIALLSMESGLETQRIKNAKFTEEERKKLSEAIEILNTWKIKWVYFTDFGINENENADICFLSLDDRTGGWPQETDKIVFGFIDIHRYPPQTSGLYVIYKDYKLNLPTEHADYFILCELTDYIGKNQKEQRCIYINCIDNHRLLNEEYLTEINDLGQISDYGCRAIRTKKHCLIK